MAKQDIGTNDKKDLKKKDKKKDAKEQEELSEQDRALKEKIDGLVNRMLTEISIKEPLTEIVNELQTATSSLTSVPKPLKFCRAHYATLQEHYAQMVKGAEKCSLADLLSVLATTFSKDERHALKYHLEGTHMRLTSWGHEYMRNLSGEIATQYQIWTADGTPVDELLRLVNEIVPYNMKHNAEYEAIDLLLETDQIQMIVALTETNNFERSCLYLKSCATFAATAEERTRILKVVYDIYMKHTGYPDALRTAFKLVSDDLVKEVFEACKDEAVLKQMAFMLARHRSASYDLEEHPELAKIASGANLSQSYMSLAKALDTMEPKLPEDIYKSHLEEKRSNAVLDSAKQNLAATFVNAFVNCGYCKDKLMTIENSNWLFKNKDQGMTAAAASIGLLLLWEVDDGLSQIDKYQWSENDHVKTGALIANGIVNSGTKNECDPAWALLLEQLDQENNMLKLGAVVGLGFAYAGTRREDILENLSPIVLDPSTALECAAMAALTLGLIFVGSCNDTVAQAIIQTLLEKQGIENSLDGPLPHFFAIGLGLVYLGRHSEAEATLTALEAITHPIGKYAALTVETFSHAGTGDVLKVQKMLHVCADHIEKEENALHQAVALLGIALIAMGEETGASMAMRSLEHVLQYGELPLRRAVPLAVALMHVSDPSNVSIIDTLSKLSHDQDGDVAMGAIFGLGLVGAGTNHARIAGLLRQLAAFYAKDANALFMVRISQGILHMGKGLITCNPTYSDKFLMDPVALGGIIVLIHSMLHMRSTILSGYPYLLFHIVHAMIPRMIITLDEDLNPLPVTVRVGQSVDVTGQAGNPKKITGFQTHTTPVLLSHSDRAELATDEYISMSPIIEGFVILKKNPDYVSESPA